MLAYHRRQGEGAEEEEGDRHPQEAEEVVVEEGEQACLVISEYSISKY